MIGRVSTVLFVLLVVSCGSEDSDDGQTETGGAANTGGHATTGGTGNPASGGASSNMGGSGETGGAASNTGGSPLETGGASAGGTNPNTGGTVSIGPIDCRTDGDGTTTLVMVNGCSESVTFRGSDIDGGTLEPGAHACIDIGSDVEPLNSKRYWGWIGEDPGGERHTLAEFTFNTDFHDFDWYNISHVDAHNLPMQIVPVGRSDCHTLTCAQSFLDDCPTEGQYFDSNNTLVSCVSPDRDNPQSPVALYFEACDDAYAWSGDDQQGDDTSPMRACAGEDWDIVFCPEAP